MEKEMTWEQIKKIAEDFIKSLKEKHEHEKKKQNIGLLQCSGVVYNGDGTDYDLLKKLNSMLMDSLDKLKKGEITNEEFMLEVIRTNDETYNWAFKEFYLIDNDRLIKRLIWFYCLDDELNITDKLFKLIIMNDMKIFDVWVKDFERILKAIEYYKKDFDEDVKMNGLKKYGIELGILLKEVSENMVEKYQLKK